MTQELPQASPAGQGEPWARGRVAGVRWVGWDQLPTSAGSKSHSLGPQGRELCILTDLCPLRGLLFTRHGAATGDFLCPPVPRARPTVARESVSDRAETLGPSLGPYL